MNTQDDFEQRLRQLAPRPNPIDFESVMYDCGFAAGRSSAIADQTSNPRPHGGLIAAILLTAVVAASGGYGLAYRQAATLAGARQDPKPTEHPVPAEAHAVDESSKLNPSPTVDIAPYDATPKGPGPAPSEYALARSPDGKWASGWMNDWMTWWTKNVAGASRRPIAPASGDAVVLTARTDAAVLAEWLHSQTDQEHQFRSAGIETPLTGRSEPMLTPRNIRIHDPSWGEWIQ